MKKKFDSTKNQAHEKLSEVNESAAFFQTKKTGTGLGLAAVKRVAAAHRGYCDVKSVAGQGSTFTIHLPIDL